MKFIALIFLVSIFIEASTMKEVIQQDPFLSDGQTGFIANFTLFFHLFHFLPSTFPTLKQASDIVA